MVPDTSTVFVLGAGFTRAFASGAPLGQCDIGIDELVREFTHHHDAIEPILESSRVGTTQYLDVELLLTRLHLGMPYDGQLLPEYYRHTLYEEVSRRFFQKLITVTEPDIEPEVFAALADVLASNAMACMTFNYDTMLDRALLKSGYDANHRISPYTEQGWSPEAGYGFYCPAAGGLSGAQGFQFNTQNRGLLLKLHGSLNWRAKRGYQIPAPLEAIVHQEHWPVPEKPVVKVRFPPLDEVQEKVYLEPGALVVPPVLDKGLLTAQPVLRTVWELAFRRLKEATTVVFIGYSLPRTDIAATYLFREGLAQNGEDVEGKGKTIRVVNQGRNGEPNGDLEARYREIVPESAHLEFRWDGAVPWLQQFCGEYAATHDETGEPLR